jgi:hypothetical protein
MLLVPAKIGLGRKLGSLTSGPAAQCNVHGGRRETADFRTYSGQQAARSGNLFYCAEIQSHLLSALFWRDQRGHPSIVLAPAYEPASDRTNSIRSAMSAWQCKRAVLNERSGWNS